MKNLFSLNTDMVAFKPEGVYFELFNKIPSAHYAFNIDLMKLIPELEKDGFSLMWEATSPNMGQNPSYYLWDTSAMYYMNNTNTILTSRLYRKNETLIKVKYDAKDQSITVIGVLDYDRDALKRVVDLVEKLRLPEKIDTNNRIGILIPDMNGKVDLRTMALEIPDVDVALNYGKSFAEKTHLTIIEKLKEKKPGMFLLHGEPGTGKTSYIKYLSKMIKERTFVFIPTNMIGALTSPSLLSILVENPNLVLILEDAEKAVITRAGNDNDSLVSSLLNLSDGIIGSLVNVSIIVTFNTTRDLIDPALCRKGRLKGEHHFGPLSVEDSQALADKLEKNFVVEEPMSLADIYNYEQENFHKEVPKPKMGFALAGK